MSLTGALSPPSNYAHCQNVITNYHVPSDRGAEEGDHQRRGATDKFGKF